MSYTNHILLCCLMLACCNVFITCPSHAFTANSLDITVDKSGDAIATFRFTLEGFIENAIPQSVLEEELTKGLTTSSDPPELKSMDKSSAVLLMKNFADTSDVPTGTEYRTATMDFKKAEIALQNSGLSSAVTADFSPATVTLTFPDSYRKEYSNVDVLPAVFHTVEDPVKVAQVQAAAAAQAQGSPGTTAAPAPGSSSPKGSVNVTSSPLNVKVSIDSRYIGESPAVFNDIAAGTHVMQFTQDGFESVSKNVTVLSGKTTNVMVVLKYMPAETSAESSSSSWVPLLIIVIGLVIIAIGGYYYWSEKKRNEWGPAKETVPEKNLTKNAEVKKTVVRDIVVRDIAAGDPVVKDIAAKDPVVKDIAPGDAAVVKGKTGSTVVNKTMLKDPVVKNTLPKGTADEKTIPEDTVVKKTLLKDIPAKEPGKKDTMDKNG
jgi:hypothetical protein